MCRSKYFTIVILIGSLCFFGNLSSASDFGTPLGTQLTGDGGSKWFTDWSPDGEWIAYCKGSSDIWIVPSAGGEPINITANIIESCIFPCFTADSKEICFDQPISDNSFNLLKNILAKINITTGEYSVILDNAVHTAWSHNGRYLAYREIGTADLYVLDTEKNKTRFLADASTELVLYKSNAYTLSCFTPDDSYIITTMYDGTKLSLFKIPIKGGKRKQLTFHEGYQWYPDCSPDGEWILYTNFSQNYKQMEIYAYNTLLEVSMPVFTGLTFRHWCDSFSPDGTKFCYLGENGKFEVFVANFPFQSQVFPAINKLIEEINELVTIGDLNNGIGNSLISKLNESVKAINKGNSNSAINQLEAFINQVNALKGKKLSPENSDEILERVQKIIDVLSKQRTVAKPVITQQKEDENLSILTKLFSLKQNSPNPFNPITKIQYEIPTGKSGMVRLTIYDSRGSLVRTLVDGVQNPGIHTATWNATDDSGRRISSGMYIYRLDAGSFTQTRKMLLLR